MIIIEYSRWFKKRLDRYNLKQKDKIKEKTWIFVVNPHSPQLKTHKLTGKLKDCWSFSIEHNLRIIFRFKNGNRVEFIDIGSHGIYK